MDIFDGMRHQSNFQWHQARRVKLPVVAKTPQELQRQACRLCLVSLLAISALLDSMNTGAIADEYIAKPAVSFAPAELRRIGSINIDWKDVLLDCGVRCVALVLHITERPAGIDAIRERVPIGKYGSSMADMRRAICGLGFQMKGVKCPPKHLATLSFPAIAQLEPTKNSNIGHFVVVLAAARDKVVVCDPSTEAIQELQADSFAARTTGYYLIPVGPPSDLAVGCVLALSGFGLGVLIHRRFFSRRNISFSSPFLILPVLALSTGCQSDKADESPKRQSLVRVDSTIANLGTPKSKDSVSHRFHVENLTDRELKLQMVQPSCDCLSSKLLPGPTLAPRGQAEALIAMQIAGRDAGPIMASAVLSVVDYNEQHHLVIECLVEGLSAKHSTYTIRPDHFPDKLPPIEMFAFTAAKSTDVRVLSVASSKQDVLIAEASKIQVGPPIAIKPFGYEHRIVVPLKFATVPTDPLQCQLTISYECGAQSGTKSVQVNVLPR